jgi:PAS domain S-box-containing protein
VILLDLSIPDSHGLDTVYAICAINQVAPVIVLTGLADEAIGRDAVKAGAQDFLVKGELNKNLLSRSIGYAIERKRSADLIKMAASEWSASFDAMVDGITIYDLDFTVIKANKSICELLGKSKNEVIGKQCQQIFHQADCFSAVCPIRETIRTGQIATSEIFEPIINKWLSVTTAPIFDASGDLSRIVHTVRDITEHRKLELQLRQSQKLESIGTLAGGIAHDFNNILTTVIGYGTLALMKITEDDSLRLYVQNILEAADRAADLTRDLLLFSRKQSIERVRIDLNDLITRNGRFLKRVISEDIIYKVETLGDPLLVLANEHQLEQVLMNLATNASDAMPHGGALTVNLAHFSMESSFIAENGFGQPGAYALLTVADTGTGMDKVTQQHIFDPFFTTKEVGKGTGLGLAVVYGIIKQYDGFISVSSEPGSGTRFSIYLPLIEEGQPDATRIELEKAVSGGTETILLAEDDALVRRLTQQVLTDKGYTVIEAEDGEDAVSVFSENSTTIDLLLFDLIMPKMNGKEAWDKIRKLRPTVKVIFSSGYAPETVRQKVLLADDIHLLVKPATPKELLRKVRSVLDGEQ